MVRSIAAAVGVTSEFYSMVTFCCTPTLVPFSCGITPAVVSFSSASVADIALNARVVVAAVGAGNGERVRWRP